jgi:metallophosphoesterase superfamily enzyme
VKIYSNSMYGRGTLFVTPGHEHPETTDWMRPASDGEGRVVNVPVQFTVKFDNGVAEVDDQLGEYMIAKRLARRDPQRIILPASERYTGRPQYAKPIEVGRPLNFAGMRA